MHGSSLKRPMIAGYKISGNASVVYVAKPSDKSKTSGERTVSLA